MSSIVLLLETAGGTRRVRLGDYLDAARDEQASGAAHDWIKHLRHARVDGVPLRQRFRVRGDSLWWFTELYLHKTQAILTVFRTLSALEGLVGREQPRAIRFVSGGHVARVAVRAFANARGISYRGPGVWRSAAVRLARLDLRARALTLAAMTSRLRRTVPHPQREGLAVAAFVHRAFWRTGAAQGEAESYIGPVLETLEARLSEGGVAYVGVGPEHNFRARRWWHPLRRRDQAPGPFPVETFATLGAMRDSRSIWRMRQSFRRLLWQSADIRRHAVIDGCDCWPIVREELAGIAWLQWPWSARAMDEAGAAIDALRPGVVLTYAEAGGWGRAIMLEARRRGIPSVGLQHGFIYRHWLNYRHEPDEMTFDAGHPDDRGFPRPSVTLLFDRYAERHLAEAGHFPAEALSVTGSPRLDALAAEAARLTPDDLGRARAAAGAGDGQVLVLVVTKFSEARQLLPGLVAAAAKVPGVCLAIKTHPAETPELYAEMAAGHPHVRVLPASAPLAPLIRASRALVTVNSTVALDAAVLGVPSLVVGLPNNLSPFVDAGMFAGVPAGAAIDAGLERILYDEGFRQQLERERRAFLTRFSIGADGRAADRTADRVVALLRGGRAASGQGD